MDEREIFKEVCESDFSFFCKQALKVLEPETTFVWNWHLDVVCNHCEMARDGKYKKLDIQVPPRTLKSMIVNVMLPCWVWTTTPSDKFLCASRSHDLSASFNMKRRDLITSPFYQSLWPLKLREDRNRIDEFANEFKGSMKSVSALGKITGEGADYLLSDDLLDAMDAFSKSKRDAVRLWYSNAFYNRAQNSKTVKRINVNQRLHQQDISYLLEEIEFKSLILPMVKEHEDRSTVEFRDPRKEGELLFPERYSENEASSDRKSLGSYGWSSQYQQRPTPIGGGIIKSEWLRFYENLPVIFQKKIMVADLTFKGSDKSDYNSFAVWGISDGKKYLIDMVRGKWTYSQQKENFKAFCEKHKDVSFKYVEDKANGSALISDLKEDILGMKEWPQKGSNFHGVGKVERLHFCQPDFELGNVYLPKNLNIIDAFIEELTGFTDSGSTTGNDDMVDTTTMALLELKKKKTFVAS